MAPIAQAVTVSLEDLKKGSVPFETLQDAFGPESLGILIVRDIPEGFVDLRRRALSYSSYLGNLPESELNKLENAKAKYLTGWSLGKETLKNGQVDTLKGSFYANCAFYIDPELACAPPTGEYTVDNFPEYLSPNIWPDEAVMPGMKDVVESLCRLIIDVAVLVAGACDNFAEQEIPDYPQAYLQRMVSSSMTTKARLLHYFPERVDATTGSSAGAAGGDEGGAAGGGDDEDDKDDWCATHLDHGCLTGLTSAMFVDESKADPAMPRFELALPEALQPLDELPHSPDPAAGLYIKSRTGETVQVKIPQDCIAFQTGEALERITGGKFRAVPHFVRGARAVPEGARIARNTLAVFTQPNLDDEVDRDQHITFGEFARGIVTKNTLSPN